MKKEIKRARSRIQKTREEASLWDKALPGLIAGITCAACFAYFGLPAWSYLALLIAFIIRMLLWW